MKARSTKPASARTPAAVRLCEAGRSFAARGDTEAAIAAFREAVGLAPGMSEAWYRLGEALWRSGDAAGADAALVTYTRTARDDAELQQIVQTLAARRLDVGERKLQARLRARPVDVAAMRLLAQAFIGQDQPEAADAQLRRALELAPNFVTARNDLANGLARRNMAVQALPHVRHLLALEPNDLDRRGQLAWCLSITGEFEEAIGLFEAVLKASPRDAWMWFHYGLALKNAGRLGDSERAYRTSLGLAPGMGTAWRSLTGLNMAAISDADIAAMRAELARPGTPPMERINFDYALGRALEVTGDYAASFAHYAAGARAWRAMITYNADDITASVARTKALQTKAFFAARAGWGYQGAAPIFIVGLPRSGSTLVEQILASHSQVEGTSELAIILRLAHEVGGGLNPTGKAAYLDNVAGLDEAACVALGETYIERTRIHRKTDRPIFTDKMPLNWEFIGFIRLILPRAKIIDARRHPMASCFSAFKHYFSNGMHFSYDLTELGRYYRDYLELMGHYDAVLPGQVHRVMYEEMVADTEGQVRLLLDFCELPFEPGCLRFWETRRAVNTASAQQVRQPIYKEGLDLWRRYEPWLGELEAALV